MRKAEGCYPGVMRLWSSDVAAFDKGAQLAEVPRALRQQNQSWVSIKCCIACKATGIAVGGAYMRRLVTTLRNS